MPIRRIQWGSNHRYEINRMKAIGVTTALSKGFPKPALMHWAARCVAEEAVGLGVLSTGTDWARTNKLHTDQEMIDWLKKAPIRRRDNAAVRGTKIHHLAEDLVFGRPVEVPGPLVGHVESCARFLDDWKIRPLLVEKVIGSYRYGYAGTFDMVAEVPDGRRILLDWKTGQSGIWPDVALQLAAYRHADSYVADTNLEMPMREVGITEAKAVHLRADGYDVIPLDTSPGVHKIFLHVLQVARAVEVMDAWKGEPEPAPK